MGEIDTRFPIDDDYGDEDEPTEEEIEEAFEAAKAEESDEETEDYDYEEDKSRPKKQNPKTGGSRFGNAEIVRVCKGRCSTRLTSKRPKKNSKSGA